MHLRITNSRPQHSMFSALVSDQQVRLSSITNTQGSPHNRLSILASQNSCMHVRFCNLPLMEEIMNTQSIPLSPPLLASTGPTGSTIFVYSLPPLISESLAP